MGEHERAFALSHEYFYAKMGSLAGANNTLTAACEVKIENGKVVPVGDIAKEVFALAEKYEAVRDILGYPLSDEQRAADPRLNDPSEISEEMMAQMFAIYIHHPAVAAVLRVKAPKLASMFDNALGIGANVNDERHISRHRGATEEEGSGDLGTNAEGSPSSSGSFTETDGASRAGQNEPGRNASAPVGADRSGGRGEGSEGRRGQARVPTTSTRYGSQARQPGQDNGSRGREAQVKLLNNFLSTQFSGSRIRKRYPRNLEFLALS